MIRHCAGIIQRLTGEQDLLARIGGEEFFVWLPAGRLEHGLGVAEQIRQAIEGHDVQLDAARINYTVSIGVRQGGDGTLSFSQLMLEADRALYRAKETGRNGVRSG